MKLPKRNLSQ